jgi:aspartyl protease
MDFHLKFLAITSWLIEKEQLAELEQRRGYLRAFQPQFLSLISNRLQLKNPDHHPNKPHSVPDIYDAARFILQGSTTAIQSFFAPIPSVVPAVVPNTSPSPDSIKMESFGAIISEFTKIIADAMGQAGRSRSSPMQTRNVACNMCGGEHFIRDCPVVDKYIASGKCRRNIKGKVVLSTGAFVPREIPGTLLRERIDEWHRRFPNQLATATLVYTIDKSLLYPSQSTYQLNSSDRITHLEAELYALRSRKNNFVPAARTRAQKARDARIDDSDDEEEAPEKVIEKEVAPKKVPAPKPDRPVVIQPQITVTPPSLPQPTPSQGDEEAEHPFMNAKDATYAPLVNRNVGSPIPVNGKKSDPAYKTQPPIYNASVATEVYSRTMETPITITQRELLSLSSEVRAQIQAATTTKRMPVIPKEKNSDTFNFLQFEDSDDEDPAAIPEFPMLAIPHIQHRIPPKGALVIEDPIESYCKSLPPGELPDPDRLVVACENAAIRLVFALVDNNRKKECILDSGCQVITISKAISHELAIAYDPSFRIRMQSANGEYDMSLGLARNVPFKIGPVTFYMQAHVIDSSAYDVLLGRPFDILTKSVIRNFANEDQTITIHDPNTGQRVTVPTIARGSHRPQGLSVQGFLL